MKIEEILEKQYETIKALRASNETITKERDTLKEANARMLEKGGSPEGSGTAGGGNDALKKYVDQVTESVTGPAKK